MPRPFLGTKPREVLWRADDRRPHSNHRRARDPAHPPHRAASRAHASARQAQAPIAAPAVPQNHLPSSHLGNPAVVPTFRISGPRLVSRRPHRLDQNPIRSTYHPRPASLSPRSAPPSGYSTLGASLGPTG